VVLLHTGHRERQAVAGAVAGADGHLTGHRVGIEYTTAGRVRRRTLDATELVGVGERELERAGLVDRQVLLQLELRGQTGGAVVGLVVQVVVRVHLRAVDGHRDGAVGPEVVQGAERREVREHQPHVLGHCALVRVLDGEAVRLARQHAVPGEDRLVDGVSALGADLDLADGAGRAALLHVLEVGVGAAAGHEGQAGCRQKRHDDRGGTAVDASEDTEHWLFTSLCRAHCCALSPGFPGHH
jgi:hypothetical protein